MSPPLVSLYYLSTECGISVRNAQNTVTGTTTDYRAIAHNGTSIGSIQIDTGNNETVWISGYGTKTRDDMHVAEGRSRFLVRSNNW